MTTSPSSLSIGTLVRLRGCVFGEPGTVLVEKTDTRPPSAPANEKKTDCFRRGGRGQYTKGTR
jgi:hypothetical protein